VVRRDVNVKTPGDEARAPYPRERLVDGEEVEIGDHGLAWVRRDGGATFLIQGPAKLAVHADAIQVTRGKLFVDTPPGVTERLETSGGPLYLAGVRASLEIGEGNATDAYVLRGEVRVGDGREGRASAGEQLHVRGAAGAIKATAQPVLAWDDWTGGLATTDRAAEPSPFGVGTVGARGAGDQGAPRFPLAIHKLDVRVTIDRDLAVTEVDETFFNPSSQVVEGIYRFRTPDGASLQRFGVDREGVVVWGRVKEKQAAAAQYQANVYQGSTEDPALLEWDAPGVYRAKLYPIGPGETRRVVVRYTEWLGRTGVKGERRLFVYPMAAEGAEGSLPHIEELTASIDLSKAGAREVRSGMSGVRKGDRIIVRGQDFVPRADLAVELFDDGLTAPVGYTSKHELDVEVIPPSERAGLAKLGANEASYVVVPVRAADVPKPTGGLDLAIVVDTSAATDDASLAIARAATTALLAHLGKDDRACVWAGDATLRPVAKGLDALAPIDEGARRALTSGLSSVERGGATDLGAMLEAAARKLDPARRGAVVYIGDATSTVGEIGLADLRAKLAKLPRPVRVFGLGVGDGADMGVLKGLSRGAFAERIGDANAAARAALRLLEMAERPALLGASIDLGQDVERVFPRDLGALVGDESVVVIGRVAGNKPPSSITITSPSGTSKRPLTLSPLEDHGDLRRRWAEARLSQMMDENVGHAAMVDLGSRHGIITPVTSFYVPTKNEMTPEELADLRRKQRAEDGRRGDGKDRKPADSDDAQMAEQDGELENSKEGGTGTRAKGEEGSMGRPSRPASATVAAAPTAMAKAEAAAQAAPPPPRTEDKPAQDFGRQDKVAENKERKKQDESDGLMRSGEDAKKPAPAQPSATTRNAPTDATTVLPKTANERPAGGDRGGDEIRDAWGQGGLGLLGVGVAGGGSNGDLPTAGPRGHFASAVAGGKGADSNGAAAHANNEPVEQRLAETGFAQVIARQDDAPHRALGCSGAASAPFEERVQLWRERLARATGNAYAVAAVYRSALASCEAPAWRERSKLLGMLLDAMPQIHGKVALWRLMQQDLGAADALYRGTLSRVKTPQEARELHDALGLRSIDPSVLEKLLKDAKNATDRVKKLRDLVAEWPDDFALALTLLDALEDAADGSAARAFGRQLRARPDADARLRTAIGELYLRLARAGATPEERAADEAEARRAFGEIVEFAPEDPVARRRLGDLLRAHGWFDEAARQYETLAKLSPDDANVALLLASAAEGRGLLEEAVKWTEKGGAAGAPDEASGSARTARALAATFLAWGQVAALAANNKEEAERISARLSRATSNERGASNATRGARVTLVWSHPELHPTLWSNALGAPMPAPDGDVTLGVSEAIVPKRADAFVEVRLEPSELEHAARLGATATLTVIFGEGTPELKVVKLPISWTRESTATQRLAIGAGEVTR
jgi:Ca-activated chloride channel family protein